jgi:catechol 2,3-dioxygenase-like lactoylglutathione lyase family enzyme
MIPARLSIVTIGARDVETLADFYRRLGWKAAIVADDGFHAFETGGAVFTLWPLESLAKEAGLQPDPLGGFRGVTLAINVEEAPMVDAAMDAARSAGATILKEAENASFGGRTGIFADPEGNAWEVAWMPGSSFGEQGALVLPVDS